MSDNKKNAFGYKGGIKHRMSRAGIMMNYDEVLRFIKDIGTLIDDSEIDTNLDFPLRFERKGAACAVPARQ